MTRCETTGIFLLILAILSGGAPSVAHSIDNHEMPLLVAQATDNTDAASGQETEKPKETKEAPKVEIKKESTADKKP